MQYTQWQGITVCPAFFVFSPGVFVLVLSPGVFSSFRVALFWDVNRFSYIVVTPAYFTVGVHI